MTKRTIISFIANIIISIILTKLMMLVSNDFIQCGKIFKIIISVAYWIAFMIFFGDANHVMNGKCLSYHLVALKVDASAIVEIFILTLLVFGTNSEYILLTAPMLVLNTLILIHFAKKL